MTHKSFHAKIASSAMYLPSNVLTNDQIVARIKSQNPEAPVDSDWIYQRTGIKTRRKFESNEDLVSTSTAALNEALERASWGPEELDFIIFASISSWGDKDGSAIPSTACKIQERAKSYKAFAYDMLAACSGFVYGAGQAVSFIESGIAKKGALICSENQDTGLNYKDYKSCILIGDVSTATLFETSDTPQVHSMVLRANDSKELSSIIQLPYTKLEDPGYFSLEGHKVFKEGVTTMASLTYETLKMNHLSPHEVDWYIYHQANKVMLDSIVGRLEIPPEKNLTNIEYMANTTAGTVPSVLSENINNGKIKRGDKVLMTAFGGGLTSGSLLITY